MKNTSNKASPYTLASYKMYVKSDNITPYLNEVFICCCKACLKHCVQSKTVTGRALRHGCLFSPFFPTAISTENDTHSAPQVQLFNCIQIIQRNFLRDIVSNLKLQRYCTLVYQFHSFHTSKCPTSSKLPFLSDSIYFHYKRKTEKS